MITTTAIHLDTMTTTSPRKAAAVAAVLMMDIPRQVVAVAVENHLTIPRTKKKGQFPNEDEDEEQAGKHSLKNNL